MHILKVSRVQSASQLFWTPILLHPLFTFLFTPLGNCTGLMEIILVWPTLMAQTVQWSSPIREDQWVSDSFRSLKRQQVLLSFMTKNGVDTGLFSCTTKRKKRSLVRSIKTMLIVIFFLLCFHFSLKHKIAGYLLLNNSFFLFINKNVL